MNTTVTPICTTCMCLGCPRLSMLDQFKKGECDTCKHCKKEKSFVDLLKGEYCVWRKEYEAKK